MEALLGRNWEQMNCKFLSLDAYALALPRFDHCRLIPKNHKSK
jgi:hypothetical protein